jgi:general secretion pathway protein C
MLERAGKPPYHALSLALSVGGSLTARGTIYMLDARSNTMLLRLQANAPKLVTALLAALIAVELGRVAFTYLLNPVKSPQPQAANARPLPQRQGVNVQEMVSWHLFGNPAPVASNQDEGSARESSANLLLAGTIASDDPKRGAAIISAAGTASKVYLVGDNVSGAALHAVYLDHVILDRSGVLELLKLPRQLPAGATAYTPPAAYRQADPRTAAAVDNIKRMVQQDPSILDQVMRTVPSYDNAAGKLRGFRAYPGRNRAIFARLGLKSGDLVTAINGTSLDDPQRSQEVLNTIQTSDHVTVTIERAGQKQDISLNIAQVAAQATQDLQEPNASAAGSPNSANPSSPDGSNGNTPGAPPPTEPRSNE